jgi:hypothetical protein
MDEDIALLARELECSLCKKFFDDPVSLPCAHVFCRRCVRSKLEGVGVFANECPSCKQPAYVKDLSKNTKVAAVAELVRAMMGAELPAPRESPAPADPRGRRSVDPQSLSGGAAAKRPRGGEAARRAPSEGAGTASASSESDDSQGLRDGFAAWAARQRELGTPSSGELEALEETAEDLRRALTAVESRLAERDTEREQRRGTASQPGGSAADRRLRFARSGVTELRKMCMAVFGRVYDAKKMRSKLATVDPETLDTALEAYGDGEDAAAPEADVAA